MLCRLRPNNQQGGNSAPPISRQADLCFTELCLPEQHPALPTTSPSHQEACTSLLDSLIHERADSRSKNNYNPAACGTKTTFTEKEAKWKGRGLCTIWRNKTPEKQLNEVEIGNLPEKGFRILIVKMIQDLGKRMEAKIEKMWEMFKEDLEQLKNKHLE